MHMGILGRNECKILSCEWTICWLKGKEALRQFQPERYSGNHAWSKAIKNGFLVSDLWYDRGEMHVYSGAKSNFWKWEMRRTVCYEIEESWYMSCSEEELLLSRD